jgi:ribosome biogenesis GTPase A
VSLRRSCTVMLLGMSGVGKTTTINRLLDRAQEGTSAFEPATKKARLVLCHSF